VGLCSTVIILIKFLLLLIVRPSETSAEAYAKALAFTWISPFGLPETITSDRGLQFTSSLWLQLCEMLNISHKQTTAYHPKSNGAVKRLHRHLKDALRARAAMATWSKELCFLLLGLTAQPWSFPG
jgi:transposase InsO family protein